VVVIGSVREDGQKVLLAGQELWGADQDQAWRAVLDDSSERGPAQAEFLLIVDGGTGLEQALDALWGDVPTQRCKVTSIAICSAQREKGR